MFHLTLCDQKAILDFFRLYKQQRDISRSVKQLKQHKSVQMIKETYDLVDDDLPLIVIELRKQNVPEESISEICDQWYGFDSISYSCKNEEAQCSIILAPEKLIWLLKGRTVGLEGIVPSLNTCTTAGREVE